METFTATRKPWVTEATPHGLHSQRTMRDGRIYCVQCRMVATGTAWDRKRNTWVGVTETWVNMDPLPIVHA